MSSVLGGLQLEGPQNESVPAGVESIDTATFTIQASPSPTAGVLVGQEVTFYVNATSTVPNATLTFLVYFDAYVPPFNNNTASPYAINVTGNPGNVVLKWTYNAPGNFTDAFSGRLYYWVKAYVQDNESSTVSKRIQYYVNYNSAPNVIQPPPNPLWTSPGKNENLSIIVQDTDNDVLTVNWEFGDGSTAQDILTSTSIYAYANQTHSWNPIIPPGTGDYFVNYTMNVSISDGFGHFANMSSLVTVLVPRNWAPNPTMSASTTYTDPEDPITFYASVIDREGDPIYWYFDFGDGNATTSYTPRSSPNGTVWNNVTHQFASSGANTTSYNVTVYTTDGPADHNYSAKVQIFVVLNHAPGVTVNISYYPETLEFNATLGYLNVTFSIQVNDADGDALNATWNMDDGLGPRYNSTAGGSAAPVEFRQWRNFTQPCQFNITVVVTDGREGHSVLRYRNATLASTNNPPMLTMAPAWKLQYGSEARPNETLNITMKVTDKEHDALTIVWDFGDNSPILVLHFNRTSYDRAGDVTVNVTHSYSRVGEYKIRIWITDNQLGYGQHNLSINASVTVKLETVVKKMVWDWWDYTSLTLFLLIPASMVIYGLMILRRRKRLDREGIDWDEYKIKKESGIEEDR